MKHDSIVFKTNQTNLLIKRNGTTNTSLVFNTSQLLVEYNHQQHIDVNNLQIVLGKEKVKDKAFPFNGTVAIQSLRYWGQDSLHGSLQSAKVDVQLKPAENIKASSFRTVISIGNVKLSRAKADSALKKDYLNLHSHQLDANAVTARLVRWVGADNKKMVSGHIGLSGLVYTNTDSLRARMKDAAIDVKMRFKAKDSLPIINTTCDIGRASIKKDKIFLLYTMVIMI